MIYYAKANLVTIFDHNGTLKTKLIICGSNLPDELMSFFIIYMFLLGYVLPLLLIAVCYFFLIQHLRKKDNMYYKKC